MINKKKKVVIIVAIGSLILCIVIILGIYDKRASGKDDNSDGAIVTQKESLLGIWQYDDGTRYEFNSDMTGGMYVGDYKYEYLYKVDKNVITIEFANEEVHDAEYSYELNDGKLRLIGGEGTVGGEYYLDKVSE